MSAAFLALLLAWPAAAKDQVKDMGGHEVDKALIAEPPPADEHRAVLEEMWQRRLLAPDQAEWSEPDFELLKKMRRADSDALELLKRKPGGPGPWTVEVKEPGRLSYRRLTKEGYARYLFVLTQDAVEYFESKGADAKWVFKLRDWDDHRLFDGRGLITEDGVRVYKLAQANREVYWKSPAGDAFGTRKPPTQKP